ncbi:MAG TPA: DsbA family oxidoreductase [Solirubrobacteraceae bacterium]|nr:DsbA family oxidoreductase [Solirubrobacteraceae bacterium]
MATVERVHVEIWSEIACPWCYVGKRRFERALAEFEGRHAVGITWRSFELDPHAPRENGVDVATLVARKYGRTREQVLAMHAEMTRMAAAEGVEFRFDLARRGNTFDAHRLLHLAAEHGLQDGMKERLLRAYHAEGVVIGDRSELERLAVEVGLPEDDARETLAGDRFAVAVREDERLAAELDIHAVPAFVVDRRVAISGAQQPALFLKLLRRAAQPAPR